MRNVSAYMTAGIGLLVIVTGVIVLTTQMGTVSWPTALSGIGAGIPLLVGYVAGIGIIGGLIINLLRSR